jgi:streptogramin lyase
MKRERWFAPAIFATALLCLWLAAQAQASPRVYWSTFGGTTIGSASPDGSEVDSSLISEASNPVGVAVDAVHVYWANPFIDTIGRANLDGSEVEKEFITGVNPFALAVAEGHVYWTNADASTIGRANLDGSGVEEGFIGNVGSFYGLAADSEHLYWGDEPGESIGRANLDGSGVNREFIEPASGLTPYGVAVDSGHVYWSNAQGDRIGRAALDGTGIEETFIANAHPAGLAVDDSYVYWGYAAFSQAIGRANLDGTGVNTSFVPGVEAAFGLATTPAKAKLTPTALPDPPAAAVTNCSLVAATAGTFTPPPRPGKLIPGVRAMITVGAPSQLNVDASLTYRAKGKTRNVALGSHSLHASPTGKLRLPLPASMRSAPALGTKVKVTLKISATPDNLPSCAPPSLSVRSFKAKVVRVLGSA